MKKIIINKYMKYFILVGIALFILPSLTADPFRVVRAESVGMSTKRLERLTNQLDDYVDKNQLSAFLISIVNIFLSEALIILNFIKSSISTTSLF